jgi:formate-nitrite transporter family protein
MSQSGNLNLAVPVSDRDHVMGPTNASVTVVNYGDYQCPDCHRRHREIQKVIDELRNAVRFVYRHFPLIKVHPHALRAAEAAEAASAQGKFWEMHRHLYLRPDKLADKDLRHYAREIGLDLERFDQEMGSGTYTDLILKDYHNSIVYGISGTPTTFINGVLYAMSGTELIAEVRTVLKEQSDKQQ